MKALIVYGSKHGSTKKIAEEISGVLAKEKFEVRTADADEKVENVAAYDIVVIGSAVMMNSWMRNIKKFVRENEGALRSRPVWMFSSGLRSDDPRSVTPKPVNSYKESIGQKEHRFFAGSFDTSQVGPVRRAFVGLPGIRTKFPAGDFRNWDEIRVWARSIAESQNSVRSV
jgi:menaquinone-dependent protoporphyrinogen oxidase